MEKIWVYWHTLAVQHWGDRDGQVFAVSLSHVLGELQVTERQCPFSKLDLGWWMIFKVVWLTNTHTQCKVILKALNSSVTFLAIKSAKIVFNLHEQKIHVKR